MNTEDLIVNGIPANEAGPIAALWFWVYPGIRVYLTHQVKTADARGGDATRFRRLRLELGQLDRCTHRACTQSPPGFSPYAALRLLEEALPHLPLELRGDTHRLAALLADRVQANQAERAALNG
ncbi:hypothetical protein [Streptomyces niveus]|uniref:hypothetical protein n=1 Tax=Streptomyces niveus TaxID=193462 RepID=UPI00343F2349